MQLPPRLANLPNAITYLLVFLAIIFGTWALVEGLRLIPPKKIVMAAGNPGSAYYEIATQYQSILAKDGIKLSIVNTAGSKENQSLLESETANIDIALIQGGIPSKSKNLNALAAVFPEPLIVFARTDADISGNPFSWTNKKVALGAHGSGTREIVNQLAKLTQAPIFKTENPESLLGGEKAANALLNNLLDVALFVAPLNAPYIETLINSSAVRLITIDNSQAVANKIADARHVTLHRGAINYEPSYPPNDMPLITLVTKLVAKDDLHPALVNRLIRAVKEVHRERLALVMSHSFPNIELLDMDADVYASKLLTDGFNPLEKFLPYWVVAQINRFALLLVPIIFILLPLFKLLPALLAWRMQSKVYRYYLKLHELDMELYRKPGDQLSSDRKASMEKELIEIESSLRSESLPLKYRESAYNAVHHVQMVRQRLKQIE